MSYYSVLVNKSRLLPPDYVPADLAEPEIPFSAPVGTERRLLRKEAGEQASRLFAQAALEGLGLMGVSGYRSYKRQEELYENAQRKKSRTVAPPGASEHQTGLALDVSCALISFELEETFAQTPEGLWLKRRAPLYGFILRYPEKKENVTGYPWEPWHIRYVGPSLALYLSMTGLTLEEYHAQH